MCPPAVIPYFYNLFLLFISWVEAILVVAHKSTAKGSGEYAITSSLGEWERSTK
jgi:hypothetical protein